MDIFFIPWVIIITIITYFVTKIVWDLAIGNPFNVNPVFFNNILIIPGLGRAHGEGNGKWLQNSCLENSMDRGAWWATVHGVAKRHDWATSLSSPTRKGTSREWKLEPRPLDPLRISKAPILNRTRLWIFLKRQNIPECTSWTCTVQRDKTPVRPPRSSRKRKLSNFENPQSTEGRNHGHEFGANHLLFFFFSFSF